LFDSDDGVRRFEYRQPFTVERVCKDFEDLGYEVQPVIVPASAVGAPHRRYRCFFIAFRSDGKVCGLESCGNDTGPAIRSSPADVPLRAAADSDRNGLPWQAFHGCAQEEGLEEAELGAQLAYGNGGVRSLPGWDGFPNQPIVRRRNDGLPRLLVRYLTKEVFDAVRRTPVFGCMLVVVGNKVRLDELCEQYGVSADTVTTLVSGSPSAEASEWAGEISDKIMPCLSKTALVGIPEFMAMCKRIERVVVGRYNALKGKALMAYGNAIVPQVMREIMQACLTAIMSKGK
jgi:hypothetical protein